MNPIVKFFYDNAGYSYDPATETAEQGRERCARELARAEVYGRSEGWRAVWRDDPDGCIGCACGNDECMCCAAEPHETLECFIVTDTGVDVLASCGGICEPSREYCRVMEAELMLEALGDIEREQRNAEECARLMAS